MKNKLKVHIFCVKQDMCKLIQKTLEYFRYDMTCTNTRDMDKKRFDEMSGFYDCIIIDSDIDDRFKTNIKAKYRGIPMVCLPSLDSDTTIDSGIKCIHEPLRLSELVKVLDELFPKKIV